MNSCFPPLAALNIDGEPVPSPPDKLQVLHDLDLYYIKQMAHSLQEVELEQKIDVEMKMREGTTKLLAACKHQSQSLQAAKSLLTSNQRMSAYLAELQSRKRHHHPKSRECVGRVCLSDLRIPLIWRDSDHFKNKTDSRRFAVFCLVRIGSQLYDTSLLSPVDPSLTDLTFPDVLLFNEIDPDFSLGLEVYSHVLREDMSIASARSKIKNTIHNSISRTVGKKLAASLREHLDDAKIGPNFELIASAKLTLDDVADAVRTHDLSVQPPDLTRKSGEGLPLFGNFCCRLAAEPDVFRKESISSETTEGDRASLQGFQLSLWRPPNTRLSPHTVITIDKDTIVKKVIGEPGVSIINEREGKEDCKTLLFATAELAQRWFVQLTAHVHHHKRWKSASERQMEIYIPDQTRPTFTRSPRQGSLYDQTQILDLKVEETDIEERLRTSTRLTPTSTSAPNWLEQVFRNHKR